MRGRSMGFLLVLATVTGSLMILLGGIVDSSPVGGNPAGSQAVVSPETWANSTRLMEVSAALGVADLAASGVPLAGFYVDTATSTIYVGLTEIHDEHTMPIRAIVAKAEGVKVEFFKARFTYAELRSMQQQIEQAFFGPSAESGIPITMVVVNVQSNGLMVGLQGSKPQYVAAIRQVIGTEVPLEIIEGNVTLTQNNPRP